MLAIALISFLFSRLITATISTTPPLYNATVFVLLNCGAQSATTDETDRRWDTDIHFPNFLPPNFSSISTTATASEQDPSVNRVPYTTGARIMRSQFTYTFRVTPGTIFLRLYFYPANYSGFNKDESFFSVTANHLTLLSNFSAFLTVSASSSKQVQKEYVINVDETQILKLTFSPSPNSYAFVNGIEILSMPTDLYIHGDVTLSGHTNPYNINNSTALETLYRLNVGGNLVGSTEDTGMYRVWDSDDAFVVGYGYQTPHFDVNITYTSETPTYSAPTIVYTTSRIMANYSPGLDWEFPLNSGFYYLFRLHFCEIQPEVQKINDRSFSISIGNQKAEREADVIQWSGGWRIPVYKDYVVHVRKQDGEQNVTLDLSPNPYSAHQNAILNGLEIFKLNDSNGNLSVPNPELFAAEPRKEIKIATCNFDENFLIGYGGFGNVYKGYIDNGETIVAVKRLNPSSKQGVREFETEIHMLSKLRHVHLVSLIGYCDDNNEMILVYDYMAHGTLRDHLYSTDNAPLPWKKRVEICIGAAKGLYYLHTGTKHTIIHRDVKSTNILLDDKWVAKVSDFGLSKICPFGGSGNTHVTTAVKGSFGYVDPEYYKRQQLTEKSDVYSFGVVLFEVLCGRPALIPSMPQGQVNLAYWACRYCKKGNVEQIIDPNLEGQIAPECLNKFAEAAYNCLRDEGVRRPSMGDVVWNLEFVLKLQDAADNRGHEYIGPSFPVNPSFPLIINGDANVRTNEDEISEVERKLTINGISMSVSRSAKLNNVAIFSEIVNPLGR
ncbi:receptor-like protein kinase FERONIA [Solanum verrucosum]|uniref:receptor-like protein kinase FERONIA n=1 Tax=Solanum verrucosum TaxID=315347 RepID=UPI0020D16733|nr:receptor-like protein kinase FERONIA [Solanum verrucosum]